MSRSPPHASANPLIFGEKEQRLWCLGLAWPPVVSWGSPWFPVALCAHSWLPVVLRGCLWLYLVPWDFVGLSVVLFGSLWFPLARCGSLWFSVVLWGSLWFPLVLCGSVGLAVVPFGSLWFRGACCSFLRLSEAVCVSLWFSVAPFISLDPCGSLYVPVAPCHTRGGTSAPRDVDLLSVLAPPRSLPPAVCLALAPSPFLV